MPVSYRKEARQWTRSPLGSIQHVVVGNGSPFRTFEDAESPRRRFSHMWVQAWPPEKHVCAVKATDAVEQPVPRRAAERP